jgi:hypothetical protein
MLQFRDVLGVSQFARPLYARRIILDWIGERMSCRYLGNQDQILALLWWL